MIFIVTFQNEPEDMLVPCTVLNVNFDLGLLRTEIYVFNIDFVLVTILGGVA